MHSLEGGAFFLYIRFMRNKQKKELAVCGIAAVKSLAKNHPERINRFYYNAGNMHVFGELCQFLSKNKRPYNMVKDEELEKLCGSVHHQGAVAMIDYPEIIPLNKKTANTWAENKEAAVILDSVGNANNFGAIVRSAVFFGIRNIVLPFEEANSMITTSSYRVAQGGMDFIKIYSINSIPNFLKDVKGKIVSIGTDLKANTSIKELPNLVADKSFVVVLGNEENGISEAVSAACDYRLIIPGNFTEIQSLNVAQAASIIFYAAGLNK